VAPTDPVFIVREREDTRELVEMRWGLVPYWSKDKKGAFRCINARSDTVETKSSFRDAFKSRPCLVPADGYYEWQDIGPKDKQPYYFTTKNDEPFAFAGLWEFWPPEKLLTFTLLTSQPNQLCVTIHDRMPVMLAKDDWAEWMKGPSERRGLLKPFPAERMQVWPVERRLVGNVRLKDDARLIEPLTS
jgi:putative SOS response-associated peptidase YedK